MDILFNGMIKLNGSYYLVENTYNCLLGFRENTNELLSVISLANDRENVVHRYQQIVLRNGKIVAFPCWANDICVYDTIDNRVSWIDISDIYPNNVISINWDEEGDTYFIYSPHDVSIFRVDISRNETKSVSRLKDYSVCSGFLFHAVKDDNVYFSTVHPSGRIFMIDRYDYKFENYSISESYISHICSAFGKIWIVSVEGWVYAWNGNDEKPDCIFKAEKKEIDYSVITSRIVYDDYYIYVFGLYRDYSAIMIDPVNMKTERVWFNHLFPQYDSFHDCWIENFYHFDCSRENGIQIQKLNKEYYIGMDFNGHFRKPIGVKISMLPRSISSYNGGIVHEDEYYDLNQLIEAYSV